MAALSTIRFHDMTSETLQTIRVSVLGSVSLMPLLILPTMVGALVDYAGFTEAEAGWVAAVGFAGSALGAIVAGLRIRHFDPRILAVVGLIFLAVFDAASIFAGRLPTWLFVTFRFVSGLGGAVAYAAVMATIATMSNPERGYGVFMVLQFGLSAIGLYGLPFLLPVIGVSGLFLILSALAVLSLFLRGSVIHRAPVSAGAAVEIHMLLKPVALLSMFGVGLYETANLAYYTYTERIGVNFGLTDYQIGEVLGLATLLGVPSALAVVWIGDRFGQLRPISAALLVSVLGLLILLYPLGSASYPIAMYMMGVAWAFGLPYFQAVEARIDPGGSVVVVGGFFTSCGAAVGPAIAATLVRPDDYDNVLLFAMGVYGVVAVLMTMCTSRIGRA
jgi:MFS family permease